MPGEVGYAETWPVIVTVREREVRLVQERDGARAEVALLRPESWFAESGVSVVGDCVELNLEELDLAGAFQVLELGDVRLSTYVRRAGFGRVTGRFQFSKGETFNLFVAGESRPIGVTGQHPFWSADRNAWVSVRDLRIGERLQVEGGTRVVEKVEIRGEEVVFNIEVEGEHCYRVGEQGVLVHNASLILHDFLNVTDVDRTLDYVIPGATERRLSGESSPLFEGKRNLGALYYQESKSGIRKRLPPVGVTPNLPGQHTERLLLSLLKRISKCAIVVEVYTERIPCARCESAITRKAARDNSDVNISVYFISDNGNYEGSPSARRLLQVYDTRFNLKWW